MSSRNTRHCPIFGCRHLIHDPYIVCVRHWGQVPSGQRKQLWYLYHTERGSSRHMALIMDILIGLDQQETGATPSSFITAKEAE